MNAAAKPWIYPVITARSLLMEQHRNPTTTQESSDDNAGRQSPVMADNVPSLDVHAPAGGGSHSGLNNKPPSPNPESLSLYQVLEQHQLATSRWGYCPVARELHRWKEIFPAELPLLVPEVAFCIGYTRARCHGYFRPGPNWYGFEREILLKECFVVESIERREFWRVLRTELHELTHAWQDEHGAPGRGNYHNAEFRTKARECGLIVDSRGYTEHDPEGPFWRLIQKHGVPDLELPEGVRFQPAATKLHKWVCGCEPQYGVRVAIEDFEAGCFRCGERFVRVGCQPMGGRPK
jgi:hypothetical protein